MALYIKKLEAIHRVGNGFVTKDGIIDGQIYNIYKENGIDISDPRYKKMLKCVMIILNSMDEDGVEVYPKDLRGSKLREIRRQQGKSGSWVAIKAGLSKTTVYDIENGLTVPRPGTLKKIAGALHVPLEELG